MTTQAYPGLSQAQQTFLDLLWDPGLKAGVTYLETAIPALRFPILKQAFEGIVNLLAGRLFDFLILIIDVTAIKLVNSAHQSAWETASLQLSIIGIEKGIDSAEFKSAREAAKVELSRFTMFGGK